MKTFVQPYVLKFQAVLARLHAILDRLRMKIPGLPSNIVLLSAAGLVMVAGMIFAALQVLVAPDQPVTTYTLPYTQAFDDVNLKRWYSDLGVWTIRTGTLMQTVGGEEAGQLHIPLKVPEDAPYHVSVFVTLKKDTKQAGLSFNAQYPDIISKQHRVYIDRLNAETLELVAGYMDGTGAFVTQVRVPLSLNTSEFRLDVYVYSNSYLVQVNGQRMIENRPLFYKNGMIGFYALGSAIFDTYKLTTAENENPGDMVYTSDFDQEPGGAGWVPISGTWQIASQQMLQSDTAPDDAAIGYETSTFENFTLRVTFIHLDKQGAGLLFNMPSPYSINGAHLVRYSDETDSIIWGYYDANGTFNRQGFAIVDPAGSQEHVLQIFSGENQYEVYLDDSLIIGNVPLVSVGGAVGLITSHSSAEFSYIEAYPLFSPASDFLSAPPNGGGLSAGTPVASIETAEPAPPEESVAAQESPESDTPTDTPIEVANGGDPPLHAIFEGDMTDAGWKALKGDWKFSEGNLLQTTLEGYDFSAIYNKMQYKNYGYQIGLTQVEGTGSGLIFNSPQFDKLNGAIMVRYSDKRDDAVVWGYFDEAGSYKNLGYIDVPSAGGDRHTMRVAVGEKNFSIYLDDRLIVQSVNYPTSQNFGYIGLISSQSSVIYDEISVDAVGAEFKGTYDNIDGFTDQRIISGKWTIGNNKAVQAVTDVSDYVWNTGVQASQYTISARITLPDTNDSGGGFIIHMTERGSKNNSYIIRFKDGGKAIWWGSINGEGKFNGQGSGPVEGTGSTFTLNLVVKLDALSIFVNDVEVAKDIVIPSQEGWIGLVAYGGPVTFEDVKLEVEK